MDDVTILHGDALTILRTLPDSSVHCVVTSPPYWGLRDYGTATWIGGDPECDHRQAAIRVRRNLAEAANACDGGNRKAENRADCDALGLPYRQTCGKCGAIRQDDQIGLEPTPDAYVARLVEVFREVRRVLRDDGTLWLNMGDSYASNPRGNKSGDFSTSSLTNPWRQDVVGKRLNTVVGDLKQKDLVGIPWRVAFALQADGWYLRSDIIWCLSGGAMLYARTQTGEGPAMLKDLVRLAPHTVQLWNGEKWTRVISWRKRGNRQGATEIVLRSGERIGCTQEHRWPMSRDGRRAVVTTRELVPGDVLDMTTLPEPDGNGPHWLVDDAYWFAGLYLAEGSRSGDTIQIAGHSKEVQRWKRVKAICEHYGALPRLYVQGNEQAIHIDRADALDAILGFLLRGRTAKDKGLSPNAWGLPNKALRLIMLGYLEGDGSLDGNRWRLGLTRNYHLEADLRCAAARLGASLTLKPAIVGRYLSFRGEWRWHNGAAKKHRGEIMEIRRSRAREFWDVSVADEPHLFALASGVLSHNSKPNPMPESVTDRPTKSHEYIFLLAKQERYYFDNEAIKEPAKVLGGQAATFERTGAVSELILPGQSAAQHRPNRNGKNAFRGQGANRDIESGKAHREGRDVTETGNGPTRNKRTVWNVATMPYSGAHFAVFPPELVKPCILAGTSERGVCPACGAPWVRIIEKEFRPQSDVSSERVAYRGKTLGQWEGMPRGTNDVRTIGWEPSCGCDSSESVPATVLDPFLGSGTTLAVAAGLGRRGIGIELNASYIELAWERIGKVQRPLLL